MFPLRWERARTVGRRVAIFVDNNTLLLVVVLVIIPFLSIRLGFSDRRRRLGWRFDSGRPSSSVPLENNFDWTQTDFLPYFN